MGNEVKKAAKTAKAENSAPKTEVLFNTPEVVETHTVKLDGIGERNKSNNKRSYRLAKADGAEFAFENDLLNSGIKSSLTVFESQSRVLTRAAKATAECISAACKEGHVKLEIAIVKTIKGLRYPNTGVDTDDIDATNVSEKTYVAGENLIDLTDGDEIHRVELVELIISKKGRVIIEAADAKQKLMDKLLSNPAVRKDVIEGLFGITIKGVSASSKAPKKADDDAPIDDNADADDVLQAKVA